LAWAGVPVWDVGEAGTEPDLGGTVKKILASATSIALLAVTGSALAADRELTTKDGELHPRAIDSLAREQRTLHRAEIALERERQRERREERLAAIAAEAAAVEEAASTGTTDASTSPELESIAQCESGGDYSANTGNGYYGAYQFTQETWESVGGSGLPSEASPAEQDQRAQMLLEQSGSSPWPNCG